MRGKCSSIINLDEGKREERSVAIWHRSSNEVCSPFSVRVSRVVAGAVAGMSSPPPPALNSGGHCERVVAGPGSYVCPYSRGVVQEGGTLGYSWQWDNPTAATTAKSRSASAASAPLPPPPSPWPTHAGQHSLRRTPPKTPPTPRQYSNHR